jgi:hypothetical protein
LKGTLLHVLALLLVSAGCDRCGPEVIARVELAEGEVERDTADAVGAFVPARVADALSLGDGLRTGANSRAELSLSPEGRALVEEKTELRFMSERPEDGRELLSIEEGVVEIDSAAIELELRTTRGVARVAARSRVRVRAAGEESVFVDVLVGRVRVGARGSEAVSAEAGETLELTEEGPRAEAESAKAESAAPGAESPDDEPPVDPEPASASSATPTNRAADLELKALERATIHTLHIPLAVRLPLPRCDETVRIEVRGKARASLRVEPGSTLAMLTLGAGTNRVEMRCGSARKSTTLRVVKDPATRELPRSAPRVDVAADGRRYTVRYQNLLPALSFAWPNAPKSKGYTLVVQRGGRREARYESQTPSRAIAPGELSEGNYRFFFRAAGGETSREGSLRITFDNTARSAYLSSPSEGAPRGTTLDIAGAALVGSDVSVSGERIPTDAQGRFRASVPHDATRDAISVRVSHPGSGVHYYIRRLR